MKKPHGKFDRPRAAEKPRNRTPQLHRTPQPPATPTHWGNVADWYDTLVGDQGSEYHREVILPGVTRMLDIKDHAAKPLKVLDLACGQGVLCRKLAAAGCTVIGLDGAPALIESAKKRDEAEPLSICYQLADATKLLHDGKLSANLQPASFDAVTLVLAVQNMTPLSPIWQAVREMLVPGGSLIIVMMHPCFRIPKHSDWFWNDRDPAGGKQGRICYEYLGSARIDIQTHPGQAAFGKNSPTTPHFHRPLQAYINTLGNAGLLIDHIEEWPSHKSSQSGPRKTALDHSRKQIPLFLALRARKIPQNL